MHFFINLFTFVVLSTAAMVPAFAGSLSEEQVRKEITRQIEKYNLEVTPEEVEGIINSLYEGFDVSRSDRLPINGVLSTYGLSAALLTDTDVWKLDGSIVSESGQLINIDNLFEIYYQNGGLKAEFAYKYMFIFIPSEIATTEALDGAVYGGFLNSIGIDFDLGLGIELGWLNSVNRPSQVYVVALKLGVGGGISFPKMTFRLRTRPEVERFPWNRILP